MSAANNYVLMLYYSKDGLKNCAALALGSPTRFGNMAAPGLDCSATCHQQEFLMLYAPKAKITLASTALIYLAVLATLLVTTFYPDPVADVSLILILSVKLIPLLLFVVPVFRGDNRGYIWLSFVVIFYFTQAVVSAWLSEGDFAPVLLAILTFALFTVAMIHLKTNRP